MDKDTRVAFASGTKTLVGAGLARLFTQQKCRDDDYLHEYLPSNWSHDEPARKRIQMIYDAVTDKNPSVAV